MSAGKKPGKGAAGKGRRKIPEAVKPQMTSLVDVLTILVFFLLKNFSTEGDIVTLSKNLDLPESSSSLRPERGPVVSISRDAILADEKPLARVAEEAARADGSIPALADYLEERRRATLEMAEVDTSVKFDGRILIQGDRKTPFAVLQKVLATCGEKGYSNFSLAVMRKE